VVKTLKLKTNRKLDFTIEGRQVDRRDTETEDKWEARLWHRRGRDMDSNLLNTFTLIMFGIHFHTAYA